MSLSYLDKEGKVLTGKYFPISSGQKGLWFLHQIDPLSSRYNVPLTLKISNEESIDDLNKVFNIFVKRHSLMRSTFSLQNDEPVRKVLDHITLSVGKTDVSYYSYKEIKKTIKELSDLPFDLEKGPLLRAYLLTGYKSTNILLIIFHHIVFDGASLRLLIDELNQIKQSIKQNISESLPPSKDFQEYVEWQKNWLQSDDFESSKQYWLDHLSGIIPTLSVPMQKNTVSSGVIRGDVNSFSMPQSVVQSFKKLAVNNSCSEFLIWYMAYFAFLSRYTMQKDIIIATPYMGRPDSSFDDIIGFFANVAPIRCHFETDETFLHLINRFKNTVYDSLYHADFPIEELISRLDLPNYKADELLFQTAFVWTYAEGLTTKNNNQLDLEVLPIIHQTAEQSLSLELLLFEGSIEGLFKYRTNKFSAETIAEISKSFICFIENLAQKPENLLSKTSLLTVDQQKFLLQGINITEDTALNKPCLHKLIEEQVINHPENIALIGGEQKLTYLQLNARANQLAHYLIEKGVQIDDVIGICSERTINMMIAMLAIFKTGAAYLPLDPHHPQQRLQYMITDSDVKIVITQSNLNIKFENVETVSIENEVLSSKLDILSSDNPEVLGLNSNNLAYVIYTSGSTGQPKGVMVEHQALTNLCQWYVSAYDITEDSCGTHLAGIGFDASISEIWVYMISAARILLISDQIRQDPNVLINYFAQQQVTHCFLPTALLEASIKQLNSQDNLALRYIFAGGEKLSPITLNNEKAKIINHYGPAEASVISTSYELSPKSTDFPAIGKAIDNVFLLVLSSEMELLPFGTIGELYIGGAGLARGYINNPILTAERFIVNPFGDDPNQRIYKTGDLVCYQEDGNLTFIGRIDNQVKIRGFRIELNEIIQQLLSLDFVDTCEVTVLELIGNKRIVAYITHISHMDDEQITKEIHGQLELLLPDYMLPSQYVILDTLPLTPNGKIDCKALPDPSATITQAITYCEPVGEIEISLTRIWSEILNLPIKSISTQANFFRLGGDSLLAIKLITKIKDEFHINLNIQAIFESNTLSVLAEHLAMFSTNVPNELEEEIEYFEI